MHKHLTYANVMVTLLAIGALTGGVAYAANTVFSEDIVDGEVKTADIGNNQIRSADVRNDNLGGGGLADPDVKEETLDVVQGRGTLLSNRLVFVPGVPDKTLLELPGLGVLRASCAADRADIYWTNTTSSPIDYWRTWTVELSGVDPPGGIRYFVNNDLAGGSGTLGLGLGNDPALRRTASVHGFAFQSSDGAPCGFQVQATLWTSP